MKNEKILIRGGRLIDPSRNFDGIADLFIDKGRISESFDPEDAVVIDASGKIVCPGFTDLHAHLREPGREDEETIDSGSKAAARGGYTSVVAMANTSPPADSAPVIEYILSRSKTAARTRIIPAGALSRGLKGRELSDMGELVRAGARAVSDDGLPVENALLMRRALEYSRMFDIPVISHCEEPSLSRGVMNEGPVSDELGLPSVPSCSEDIMVFRDIELCRLTGGRLHIAHVSSKGSVEIIRRAKEDGVKVTAEATPHHLALTDDKVRSFGTNFRMNPPLRSKEDSDAIKHALKNGIIDAVATDHAPHCTVEKEDEFQAAPPGVTGLETALGVIMAELVIPGIVTLYDAIALISTKPSAIIGLDSGKLSAGSPADVCIFDPCKTWKVREDSFFSKSCNSAFLGRELTGTVEATIFGGRVVFRNGSIV